MRPFARSSGIPFSARSSARKIPREVGRPEGSTHPLRELAVVDTELVEALGAGIVEDPGRGAQQVHLGFHARRPEDVEVELGELTGPARLWLLVAPELGGGEPLDRLGLRLRALDEDTRQ